MLIKSTIKKKLIIIIFLAVVSIYLLVLVLLPTNRGETTRNDLKFPPYGAYLTNEESIEKIYIQLQDRGFNFQITQLDERPSVIVAPRRDSEETVLELTAEIVFVDDQGINIAFVSSMLLAGSDYVLNELINLRSWHSFHLERAFQEEHDIEVDKIFFTLGRIAQSEEEREEHMEIIIRDLEQQIQEFINELRSE